MKKLLLILVPLLVALSAQQPSTRTYLDQLVARSAGTTPAVVMVLNGQLTLVQLGPGVGLTSLTPPTLGITSAAVVSEPHVITAASTTITLAFTPLAGNATVYRNGMRLTQGVDYTISGAVVTFSGDGNGGPGNQPQAGDLYTIDYSH